MNDDRPGGTGEPEQGSAATARECSELTQEVHLDLSEPVTREEVGVAPGEPGFILERAGGDRFLDVELTLPGVQVLREGKGEDSGRVFLGPPLGYLRPSVEISYRGSERRAAINDELSWDAPAPSAGTSAAPA